MLNVPASRCPHSRHAADQLQSLAGSRTSVPSPLILLDISSATFLAKNTKSASKGKTKKFLKAYDMKF